MTALGNMARIKQRDNKWIPWYFVLFFAVIAVVDGGMVYTAITTQTGLVTEQAYEKGLAYDKILDRGAAQAKSGITQKAIYENGVLRWTLHLNGAPLTAAHVTAHIVRPVQDGHDFDLVLKSVGGGVYESKVMPPFRGLWRAGLEAKWNETQTYLTALDFIVP